ncbi:MAG: tetratricopeptide repeat protein, partial [Sandaracinaceae bacterium]|nr:tetratricopeptide repeat protein [Sandaracinaceae bacterium]
QSLPSNSRELALLEVLVDWKRGDEGMALERLQGLFESNFGRFCALGARIALSALQRAQGQARKGARERAKFWIDCALREEPRTLVRIRWLRERGKHELESEEAWGELRQTIFALLREGASQAALQLAQALLERGGCAEALEIAREVGKMGRLQANERLDWLLFEARCLLCGDGAEAALRRLDEAWGLALRARRSESLLEAIVDIGKRSGRLEACEGLLRKKGLEALGTRAQLLEELGREEESLALYRQALRLWPDRADLRERLIALLWRLGRDEEALGEQIALVHRFRGQKKYAKALVEALMARGRRAEALEWWERLRRDQRDVEAMSEWAEVGLRLEARPQALALLEEIVKRSPRDASALGLFVSELANEGPEGLQRAIEWIEKHVARRGSPDGHIDAARIYIRLRQNARALAHLQAARLLESQDVALLELAAELYGQIGDEERVEQALTARVSLQATTPSEEKALWEAEKRLVASWFRRGRLESKLSELRVRWQSGERRGFRLLVEALRRSKRFEEALALLQEGAGSGGRADRIAEEIRAQIHRERGDVQGESDSLMRLVEGGEEGEAYLPRLLELFSAQKKREVIARWTELFFEGRFGNPDLGLNLARFWLKEGDAETAQRLFVRLVERVPQRFDIVLELAELLRVRGELAQAMELLLRVIAESPSDELREEAAELLLELAHSESKEEAIEKSLFGNRAFWVGDRILKRLGLGLYARLLTRSRGLGDQEGVKRWFGRALPIIASALRESDLGLRKLAQLLLIEYAGPAAKGLIWGLVADRLLAAQERARALEKAIAWIGPEDRARLEALIDSSDEALAHLALYGLAKLEASLPPKERRLPWVRWHARNALGIRVIVFEALLGVALPNDIAAIAPPWIAAWLGVPGPSLSPSVLLRRAAHAFGPERNDLIVQAELVAAAGIDETEAQGLAHLALGPWSTIAPDAARILHSRPLLHMDCLPPPRGGESLEEWLGRGISACPKALRDPHAVAEAWQKAIFGFEQALLPSLLEDLAERLERPPFRASIPKGAWLALQERLPPIQVLKPKACESLLRMASSLGSESLNDAIWLALLARPEIEIRAQALRQVPWPRFADAIAGHAQSDPSWRVRWVAFKRMGDWAQPAPLGLIERGLRDESLLVRRAALALMKGLDPHQRGEIEKRIGIEEIEALEEGPGRGKEKARGD